MKKPSPDFTAARAMDRRDRIISFRVTKVGVHPSKAGIIQPSGKAAKPGGVSVSGLDMPQTRCLTACLPPASIPPCAA